MKKATARKIVKPLTRERIGEAALAHIEAHGRASLSMRNLAADLGCEAMSLYHHVEGVEGVRDEVVDRLLAKVAGVLHDARDPRKGLEAYAKSFLALAEDYPEAFPLVPTRLWRTPAAMSVVSLGIKLLQNLGLPPRAALRQARVIGAYLGGAGLALSAWRRTGDALSPDMQAAAKSDAQLGPLRSHVTAREVRADLDAGLKQIFDAIEAQRR
jgi:AcrR family transcriptional regulator